MKLKNWIFVSGAVIILSSCGENSTTESETSKDSTASAAATDNTTVAPATASVEVPVATRTTFETKYPGASNVTWSYYDEPYTAVDWEWTTWPSLDQKDYLVRYNWEGTDYYSFYDQDGNWVGSTAPITNFEGLPGAVNSTIRKEFPGYTVISVDKEHDKNREAYEIELEKGNDKAKALIAADGKLLKKKGPDGKVKVDVK
jgi:hypothetical protein